MKEEKNERKGKFGKYCPFRENNKCGDYCGLWCNGLNCCVFHALNKNFGDMNKTLAGLIDMEKK